MKKKTVKEKAKGLASLKGQKVTLFCLNYIYHGELLSADECNIHLSDAYIVYETGAFSEKGFKDAQFVAKDWWVKTGVLESYGVLENK